MFKVKKTKLNLLHNKVRQAQALKIDNDKYYQEYKKAGGKRSKSELLKRRPISDKG